MIERLQKFLSLMFPPRLPQVDDFSSSADYLYRTSRTGVDHVPGMYVGRVKGSATPRRIILLGPSTQWD